MSRAPRFIIKTLGCKANQYDSQLLREELLRRGFVERRGGDEVDVSIINTCTVTAHSNSKSRKAIRALERMHPNSRIVVTGCYAHTNPGEIGTLPGVDIVADNPSKRHLADRICEALEVKPVGEDPCRPGISFFSGHTRAFVKIQDGCDKKCAYCIVRVARGPSRSRAIADILDEIERLVGNGYREVVLTGIHIGSFGLDDGRKENRLPELIERLEEIQGLLRVRLSSVDPNEITDGLIAAMRSSRQVCHHVHIPLQSGSDTVLRKMNREYTRGTYLQTTGALRNALPDISITTDVMIGFPGESEGDFDESRRMVSEVEFAKVHIFPFSSRPGTAAHGFTGRIPSTVIKERAAQLSADATVAATRRRERLRGEQVDVLIEGEFTPDDNRAVPEFLRNGQGILEGFSSHYLRTVLPGNGEGIERLINRIVPVDIVACDEQYLYGRLV